MACWGYKERYNSATGDISRVYREYPSAQCQHDDCAPIPNPSIFA